MPSETEHAWAAGIIDGDGCLTLKKSAMGKGYAKPLLVVDNTDIEILQELQRLYGGNAFVKKKKSAVHHRQAWSWRVTGADKLITCLECVYPYMHCPSKKERARLVLEEYKLATPRNGYYTPDLRVIRENWEESYRAAGSGRGSQRMEAWQSGLLQQS